MTPLSRTLCVLVLGCGFAGSALAAMDSAGSTSGQNAAPSAQAPSRISQRLRDDLTKAGFTDITIMPLVVPRPGQGLARQSGDDGHQSGRVHRDNGTLARDGTSRCAARRRN